MSTKALTKEQVTEMYGPKPWGDTPAMTDMQRQYAEELPERWPSAEVPEQCAIAFLDGVRAMRVALAPFLSDLNEATNVQKLCHALAGAWLYGKWKVETPGEQEQQEAMEALGWWPITEDELVARRNAPYTRPASAPDITGLVEAGDALNEAASDLRMTVREKGLHHFSDKIAELCSTLYGREADWSLVRLTSKSLSKSYTKQEVEAMLKEILAEESVLHVDDGSGGAREEERTVFSREIKSIAAQHGLNTDTHG